MTLFLLLSLINTSFANDTASMGTASNISFIKNNSVVIHKETLTIGPMISDGAAHVPIKVEYLMENTSSKPEVVQMAFPVPGCNFYDFFLETVYSRVTDAGSCTKRSKMEIHVDKKSVNEGSWVLKLSVDGKPFDETKLAKSSGLTAKGFSELLTMMPDFPEESPEKDKQFDKEIANVCAKLGGKPDSENSYKCEAMKKISAQYVYVWNHTFASKTKTEVTHDYDVESTWNKDWRDQFDDDVFCLNDPSVVKAWKRHDTISAPFTHHNYIGYILKTGANWARPIENFELILKKKDEKQLVSTCFDGLKKTGPLEFRATKKNFTPTKDLYVLFFYAKALGHWNNFNWVPSNSEKKK